MTPDKEPCTPASVKQLPAIGLYECRDCGTTDCAPPPAFVHTEQTCTCPDLFGKRMWWSFTCPVPKHRQAAKDAAQSRIDYATSQLPGSEYRRRYDA